MKFSQLFSMYTSFMQGNSLRHQDLVNPICAFALANGQRPSDVVVTLQAMYVLHI